MGLLSARTEGLYSSDGASSYTRRGGHDKRSDEALSHTKHIRETDDVPASPVAAMSAARPAPS